jgi:hypothetical protein
LELKISIEEEKLVYIEKYVENILHIKERKNGNNKMERKKMEKVSIEIDQLTANAHVQSKINSKIHKKLYKNTSPMK